MPTPSLEVERPSRPAQRGPRGTAPAVLVAAAAAVGGSVLIGSWLDDMSLAWSGTVLALAGGSLLLWLALRRLTTPTFGAANSVTLARGVLVLLLGASLGAAATSELGWLLVAIGAVAVLLDGVDGTLARNRGERSDFGARFDMETDALLILVLAALVWQHGKAGAWVLLAGLLRYLFVAASSALPWLGAALPPSRRRQTVCVVQAVSLLVALVPAVPPAWSVALAAAGLGALVWSFGIDVVWLARHARS